MIEKTTVPDMNQNEETFTEIKNVMRVISMHKEKHRRFVEELDFFCCNFSPEINNKSSISMYVGALWRLEDEVRHLCVDTYSLHRGIAQKKSLYLNVIKQQGKLLSKVNKTPLERDRNNLSWIGDDGKERECTKEEADWMTKKFEKYVYESRKELRDSGGITSYKHEDLDRWMSRVVEDNVVAQLASYRDDGAHRYDSLKKIKQQPEAPNPKLIREMLNTVQTILESYEKSLQTLLGYTKSQYYTGLECYKYDSLSRLKLADKVIKQRRSRLE